MSAEARPEATPFEPGSDALPPALEPAITDPDSPILLLVAPDTGDEAVRTAVGLADARGRAGHPTVLADASLREPRLHELLDVDNLEGLADVFLFGASLDRVRSRPPTRAFDFVPVGAYVPEPGAVLESSRWERLAAGLHEDGERLLVFVRSDSPGLGLLSKRVGRAVLIGDERSVARAAERLDPSCQVVAVVEPVPTLGPDRLAAEAGSAAEVGSATIFDEPDLTEPVVFRSQRKSRPAVSPVLLLLLAVALVAAGWFAWQEYFAAPAQDGAAAATPAEEVTPPEGPGEPVETPIPVSVAVEAHQDLSSALDRAAALNRAEPALTFYVSPLAVRGVLYNRLLAGNMPDEAAGTRLNQWLFDAGYTTETTEWAVKSTELAFHFGEYETRAAALARVDSLAALELPAYVVPIGYERGPDRYRVYGGGYANETEARPMRELIEAAGLEARLLPRTGRPNAVEGS